MKRLLAAVFATAFSLAPASAALKIGAAAPDFTAPATLGGKEFTFALSDALKKGPVVLYFYPAAFTKGCTIEAHEFADAMPRFQELGVTVIGVSHDNIATLDKFSTTECKSKFPVAADADQRIMTSYDAVLSAHPEYANRTSYVIAPDGHILAEYTDLDPTRHVDNMMAAITAWKAGQK
ncbi:MAG TPA: peroxiredoxin [Rhizomicrobium sp.]|jgi:peroxiredoxin|nr:peroxiredoxin [Rhizomicrobium sp.]